MKKILLIIYVSIATSSFSQTFFCDNLSVQEAYRLAVNTIDINTRRGILAAGGDYGGEWTRDIAINSWNCVSLLRPTVAENSLWSVTVHKDSIGHQYWDKIIWSIAALHHYKVTGDRNFLRAAYKCSKTTMEKLEQSVFNPRFGLFTGPSVFNDGIAGYPAPIFEKGNPSSFVLDHKMSANIMCLSSNCLYFGAYKALAEMAEILKVDKNEQRSFFDKSTKLQHNILKYLYSASDRQLCYLMDGDGKVYHYQEGLGLAFAVIFGVIDLGTAHELISSAKVSAYGIASISPDFERYSATTPGRHNNIIWPMVNGFFAQAACFIGNYKVFDAEMDNLIHLALDADKGNYNFREIYNAATGVPDGGWQCDHQWESCKHQTWSATAFINMIHVGVLGMRFENDRIIFRPHLPRNIHYVKLSNLKYCQSDITIVLKGIGDQIKKIEIDGKVSATASFNTSMVGKHFISIELK